MLRPEDGLAIHQHQSRCHATFRKFHQMYGEKVHTFGLNNNFWEDGTIGDTFLSILPYLHYCKTTQRIFDSQFGCYIIFIVYPSYIMEYPPNSSLVLRTTFFLLFFSQGKLSFSFLVWLSSVRSTEFTRHLPVPHVSVHMIITETNHQRLPPMLYRHGNCLELNSTLLFVVLLSPFLALNTFSYIVETILHRSTGDLVCTKFVQIEFILLS